MQSRLPPKDQIGNYTVGTSLSSDSSSLQDQVKNLIGEEASEKLFNQKPESFKARQDFYYYCDSLLTVGKRLEIPSGRGGDADAITMEDFLGKAGIELYLKALEEEKNSDEFRAAVVLMATQYIPGPKLEKPFIEVIGGVSGSGKSTGGDAAAVEATRILPKVAKLNVEGNYVVSVDGGIERQVSQMRGLLLQVAIANGFPGIDGIDSKEFKIGTKKIVEEAALASNKVSVKIPLTFADPREHVKSFFSVFNSTTEQYEKKYPGKFVIFCETVPVAGREVEEYRELVRRMGNQRAWLSEYGGEFAERFVIKMNNHQIGCESKRYEPQNFDSGLKGTQLECQRYLARSRDQIYISIVNDLLYVYKDEKTATWNKCPPSYTGPSIRLTERDYKRWLNETENKGNELDLPEWIKANKGKLAPIQTDVHVRSELHQKDIKSLFDRVAALSLKTKDLCNPSSQSSDSGSRRGSGFLSSRASQSRVSRKNSQSSSSSASNTSSAGRGRSDSSSTILGGLVRSKLAAVRNSRSSRSSSSSIIEVDSSAENSANSSQIEQSNSEERTLLINEYGQLVKDISESELSHSDKSDLLKSIESQLDLLCRVNQEDKGEKIKSEDGLHLQAYANGILKAIRSITKGGQQPQPEEASARDSMVDSAGQPLKAGNSTAAVGKALGARRPLPPPPSQQPPPAASPSAPTTPSDQRKRSAVPPSRPPPVFNPGAQKQSSPPVDRRVQHDGSDGSGTPSPPSPRKK